MNTEAGLPPDPAPEQAPTAGALLKAARERQGLHIAALAAAIKVSPRKLEALEGNRFDELPDATFTRALAQTVCRTLKIDPRPVLDLMPAAGPQPLLRTDRGLNEPYREPVAPGRRAGDESPLRQLAMRPMLWGAGLLLLASVALYWLPTGMGPAGTPSAVPEPAASASGAASAASMNPPLSAAPEAASAPLAASEPALSASAQSLSTPSSLDGRTAAVVAPAPLAETVFAAPPGGGEAGRTDAAILLQLRVQEASWVEVRDARGGTLLSRTVQPGERVGLNGATPLALVIGNAAATELVFRGQSVDLISRSRDNVARLQLP